MTRAQRSIESFYSELRASDPAIVAEMERARGPSLEAAVMDSMESPSFQVETIVLTTGRPVLDIRNGATAIEINEVESEVWKDRLANANSLLAPNIPAVGRIELLNHPRGVQWLGTGWLLRDNVVVTNRHVAELFGQLGGEGFQFRPGFDGTSMKAKIDFLEEFGSDDHFEFPLFKIMHIERDRGPDLAFLRIEPVDGQSLPNPVTISSASAQEGEQVAVIGYPARDPFFPDPDTMDRIFNHRYDKKRLAPGLITGKAAGRVFHDCSTLGGNSGGEVISLSSGHAVALHFAGTLFTKNHAVPIDVVASRLDDVLQGRARPTAGRTERRPSEDASRPTGAAAATPARVLEATIPIKVRVEIGAVTSAIAAATGATRQVGQPQIDAEGADDDLVETAEARAEDYGDREGYDPSFLGDGFEVPLPEMVKHQDDILHFTVDGETRTVLDYMHFSVLMSVSRRLCRFSACNLDGKNSKKKKRTGWQFDGRVAKPAQIMNECYGNEPKFSRGHMTRREDPVWGSDGDALLGNSDSMHVTNAVPQIQPFNAGIWLGLEDYALDHAREDDMRICVFTGPFLSSNDPIRFDVKIPITFWKVIAFIHDETGELCATGYTMSQKSFLSDEEFVFGQHENHQRPIAEIERRAGISFGPLAELDPLVDMEEAPPTLLMYPHQIRFV